MLNITSFEACSKEGIRLGDNMREGDKTITISITSIVGSKDPNTSSSQVSKVQSKEAKYMNINELADLIVVRLNPQTKNVADRDNRGNVHLYLRHDMFGAVCAQGIIHLMSVQGYVQDHQP